MRAGKRNGENKFSVLTVALILAVNPGNRHSPTLARLARELPGCELIGAESCAVAIKAISKRVPDVLLLPAAPPRGEADLIAHLRTVPGGVLTLKLPAPDKADPLELARQIREMLTGVPVTVAALPTVAAPPASVSVRAPAPVVVETADEETPEYVVDAAVTAISWIRARRAQWSEPIDVSELDEVDELEVADEPAERNEPETAFEPDEPKLYEPIGPYEAIEIPDEPNEPAGASVNGRFSGFVPRAAAAAVVVALGAAAFMFWPRSESSDAPDAVPQSVAPKQESVAPPAAVPPEPPAAAPPASASGWVAITVPFEVSITEDGQPVPLDEQGRVVLPAGKHRLRFQNGERGYDATRTVEVRPAETTALTLTPETTIGVTSNEPAEVLIDGTRAGDTPYEGRVALGTHTVTVKTADAERQLTIDATSKPVMLEVDFSKP